MLFASDGGRLGSPSYESYQVIHYLLAQIILFNMHRISDPYLREEAFEIAVNRMIQQGSVCTPF